MIFGFLAGLFMLLYIIAELFASSWEDLLSAIILFTSIAATLFKYYFDAKSGRGSKLIGKSFDFIYLGTVALFVFWIVVIFDLGDPVNFDALRRLDGNIGQYYWVFLILITTIFSYYMSRFLKKARIYRGLLTHEFASMEARENGAQKVQLFRLFTIILGAVSILIYVSIVMEI